MGINSEKKSGNYTLADIREIYKAKAKVEAGELTQAAMDEKYPGWQPETEALEQSLGKLSQTARGMLVGGFDKTITDALAVMRKQHESISQIAGSIASRANLEQSLGPTFGSAAVPIGPFKSGEEYAIERLENRITDLAESLAATADNTAKSAEIGKLTSEQTIVLVQSIGHLVQVTSDGIRETGKLSRRLVWLTGFLLLLTAVLALPELARKWTEAESLRAQLGEWVDGLRR